MIRAYLNALAGGGKEAPPFLWVGQLSRGLLDSGEFAELVARGATGADLSAIAVAHTLGQRADIADDVRCLGAAGMNLISIWEVLLAEDVGEAADALSEIYAATDGATGLVSTDGPWILADSPEELVRRAKHFWHRLARPNVMLNLPVTDVSLRALTELFAASVSVNLTGVCSLARLDDAWNAWVTSVSAWPEGKPLPAMAISASPFRLGGLVDMRIGQVEGLPRWAPAWQLVGRAGHSLAWALHSRHEMHGSEAINLLGDVPTLSLPQLHWQYDKVACGCGNLFECLQELPLSRVTLVLPRAELARWIRTGHPVALPKAPDDALESELTVLGISMRELISQVEVQAASECSDGGRLLSRRIATLCQPGL